MTLPGPSMMASATSREVTHAGSADDSLSRDNHSIEGLHHREVSKTMEDLKDFCKVRSTAPESVCIAAWLIVLYHMTGKSDISLDVENRSSSTVAEQAECNTIHVSVKSTMTPLELMSHCRLSDIPAPLDKWNSQQSLKDSKDKHIFKMIEGSGSFEDELDQISSSSSSQNYVSHTHLCIESGIATLQILWREGTQDPDEVTAIFNHIYTSVLSQPDASVQSMGSPTLKQLGLLQNNPQTGSNPNIPDLIRWTSSTFPSRTAVHAWDGDLSYHELEVDSDRWAKILLSRGVAAGEQVLHSFEQSRSAIIAWIAILKAGCTCVPIAVPTPPERLKTILDSTGCKTAICDTAGSSHLDQTSLRLLTASELDENVKEDDIEINKIDSSGTAAIIFTSGSTGQPKGVIQTHDAITSSVVKVAEALRLDEESRLLQFAPHCFDASISEIFTILVAGGCLCIPAPDKKLVEIAKNIVAMEVTHAILTPSVAKMLSVDQVPNLKNLSVGGEPCSSQLREIWSPHLQFNVLYGATEGAVWDTISNIQPDDDFDVPSIGFPISSRVWVVHPDEWTLLSPIGVPGEICIQGPGIAEGYLEDQQKTQEAFKEYPPWLAAEDSTLPSCHRIYRTGDLGQVMKDGSLHLFGRMDRQIKINGERIEPGEVEATLQRFLPDHLDAFVDALTPQGDKERLVAYFSHEKSSEPSLIEESMIDPAVRKAIDSCQDVLPDTMVPSIIVPLTSFPMTQTNKIDRQAMKQLGMDFLESQNAPPSPDDATEEGNPENDDAKNVKNTVETFLQDEGNGCNNGLDDSDITLKELGIDSIDAVSLASTLKDKSHIDVSASKLLDPQVSVGDLIDTPPEEQKDPQPMLGTEISEWTEKLDEFNSSRGHSVLLTGPNGFLGREILHKILDCPLRPTVTCLMRGEDYHHAHERLVKSCRELSWWSDALENRVEVWVGDLTQPRAGLGEQQWDTVFGLNGQSRHFDVVIHNGAVVNWLEPYESLRDTNVFSTHEFLAGFLRSQDPPQTIYVSGGYLSSADETHEELVDRISHMPAYDQTKFVSEVMIEHVQSLRGLMGSRVWTFKPGFIVGSTKNGYAQTGDTLWRMVKACVQAGCYSQDDAQNWITAAGVDIVASMLVDQILSPVVTSNGRSIRKVLDGMYLQEIWDFLDAMDIHVKPMEHEEWYETIQKDLQERGQSHPLFPLKEWFEQFGGRIGVDPPTDDLVSEENCRESREAVKKSLEFLVSSGFVNDRPDSPIN